MKTVCALWMLAGISMIGIPAQAETVSGRVFKHRPAKTRKGYTRKWHFGNDVHMRNVPAIDVPRAVLVKAAKIGRKWEAKQEAKSAVNSLGNLRESLFGLVSSGQRREKTNLLDVVRDGLGVVGHSVGAVALSVPVPFMGIMTDKALSRVVDGGSFLWPSSTILTAGTALYGRKGVIEGHYGPEAK